MPIDSNASRSVGLLLSVNQLRRAAGNAMVPLFPKSQSNQRKMRHPLRFLRVMMGQNVDGKIKATPPFGRFAVVDQWFRALPPEAQ